MKMPTKNTIETVKTVVIAVLVTAIIAFIGGMKFQAREHAQVQSAVNSAVALTDVKK
jgi:cell division protein FtsN